MILVKGEGSKIVWANKAFRDHYNLTNLLLNEMIDAPFVAPDFTKQYIIDDKEVWDSGKPLLIECEPVVRYDGVVRKFQTLKTPIFGPHHKVLFTVGISRDITEKIENQEKFMTASKMAAIGEMAGGMAHEINNPIAVISGKSYILRRHLNKGAEINKEIILNSLDTIDHHVKRVANVISCLRRLSTSDDFEEFSHVDIWDLIQDTLNLCEAKIKEKGIFINLDVPKGVMVDARVVQLSQALLNLITNAADAAEVSIDKWIKIEVKTSEDKINILVSDSGSGVPDEILGKIFQPFFTTKEIGKGSGLGLSFSLSVARNHNGTLRVCKEISSSCFELQIPIKRP
jgi:C4-dicarboxylate-specific signal transduction histidine kinase